MEFEQEFEEDYKDLQLDELTLLIDDTALAGDVGTTITLCDLREKRVAEAVRIANQMRDNLSAIAYGQFTSRANKLDALKAIECQRETLDFALNTRNEHPDYATRIINLAFSKYNENRGMAA